MSVLNIKLTSSTEATTSFNELSLYGNHIIGYVKDLRFEEFKKIALELDLIQDNLLEKDLRLVIITLSRPSSNELIRNQLGFKSIIYTVLEADLVKFGIKTDKEILLLENKKIEVLKSGFSPKGIKELAK